MAEGKGQRGKGAEMQRGKGAKEQRGIEASPRERPET